MCGPHLVHAPAARACPNDKAEADGNGLGGQGRRRRSQFTIQGFETANAVLRLVRLVRYRPGTWNLEPGTWNLEPGTWNLEPLRLVRDSPAPYPTPAGSPPAPPAREASGG